MAVFRINTSFLRDEGMAPTLIEDPTPGSNYMYFEGQAYDKTTLKPLHGKRIRFTANTGDGSFGWNRTDVLQNRSMNLFLSKPSSDMPVFTTNTSFWGHDTFNLSMDPFISLDPSNQYTRSKYYTNGTDTCVHLEQTRHSASEYYGMSSAFADWINVPSEVISDRGNPRIGSPYLVRHSDFNQSGSSARHYGVYYDSSSNKLVTAGFGQIGQSSGYGNPFAIMGYNIQSFISQGSITAGYTTNQPNWFVPYFIGTGLSGSAIWMAVPTAGDYSEQIYKTGIANNSSTLLHNFTTAPAAGGTSAGGNRDTSFGSYINNIPSKTFVNQSNNTFKCLYKPFRDTNGKYHPRYFEWNTATDVFTVNTNITVNWGNTNQDLEWTFINNASRHASNRGFSKAIFNDTFVLSGTRYLYMMNLDTEPNALDNQYLARNIVTFTVDANDNKILTYHSTCNVPSTARSIVFLNDDRTLMGVFSDVNFYILSFNSSTGWNVIKTFNTGYVQVGRDSMNRIWASKASVNGLSEVQLLSIDTPITISVASPNTSYNFTGTNISANLAVNAYDSQGARVATAVRLIIEGGSMVFAGNNLSATVNTSNSATTSVPITITGGGFSTITASVVL